MIFLYFTFASLFCLVTCELISENVTLPSFSSCQNLTGLQNFTSHKFMGVWYAAEYLDVPLVRGLKCITFRYIYQTNGDVVEMMNGTREVNILDIILWKSQETMVNSARIRNSSYPAVMSILSADTSVLDECPYSVVLDTDYFSYGVMYTCLQPLPPRDKIEFLWILTRKRDVWLPEIHAIKSRLQEQGISTDALVLANNNNC